MDTLSPELELAFHLAGCAERRAGRRELIRDLLGHVDFRRLERELTERRLLPLIGSRAIAVDPGLPEPFQQAVAEARAAASAHGMAIAAATQHLVVLLERAGIPSLPLKGPELALQAFGDIGLRSTSDIDLLIPRAGLNRAAGLLQEHGYAAPHDSRRPDGLPHLHWSLHHMTLPTVELHWRVFWYESAFSADMLARSTPGAGGPPQADAADLAAALLLFYARDGFSGLKLACDIGGWWDRTRDELARGFLCGHLQRYPRLALALRAAAAVAEQTVGVPAVNWLGGPAPLPRRAAAATRLADWTQVEDRDQLRANISLVGGLVAPSGSLLDFAQRELRPDGAGNSSQLLHPLKMVRRYIMALWRVRGARSWAALPGVRGHSRRAASET